MKTLNKIKNWFTTKELYKTLADYGILYSILCTFMACSVFVDGVVGTDREIVDVKSFLIFTIVFQTFLFLLAISKSNNWSLFISYCKKHLKVIQTLIVITFFEVLYILSYSPKMMIPESVMESILIALPAFKFCVFIYVVTLNRIANEEIYGKDNV